MLLFVVILLGIIVKQRAEIPTCILIRYLVLSGSWLLSPPLRHKNSWLQLTLVLNLEIGEFHDDWLLALLHYTIFTILLFQQLCRLHNPLPLAKFQNSCKASI